MPRLLKERRLFVLPPQKISLGDEHLSRHAHHHSSLVAIRGLIVVLEFVVTSFSDKASPRRLMSF